ncbi:MAG TPA: hypothetical protein VF657_20860, partial [Actinoplanes sp.]
MQTDQASESMLRTRAVPPTQRNGHESAPGGSTPDAGPNVRHWLHSALTLAAIMGLAVGTRALWTSYALT